MRSSEFTDNNVWKRHGKCIIFAIAIVALQLIPIKLVQAEPTPINTHFTIERIFTGKFEPSSMTFLGPDDILVLSRDEGKVYSVSHGVESGPLLDENVATDGYRGLLGVISTINEMQDTNVFLYFTEAR